MAVGSSSCSSLPAQDLELEREMKIYIHDAASSLRFNLKTEQEEIFSKGLFPFPLVLANLYATFTAQSDLLPKLKTNQWKINTNKTPFLQGFFELRVLHAQCYSAHIWLQTEIPHTN